MQCFKELDNTFLHVFQKNEVTDRDSAIDLSVQNTKEMCKLDDSVEIFIFVIDRLSDQTIVLTIVDPGLDDACLIANLVQFCTSPFEVIDLLKYTDQLEGESISKEKAISNTTKIFDTISAIVEGHTKVSYQIREYRSLSEIVRDPFADGFAKVYKYCDRFYTKTSSCEFSFKGTGVSEGFLDEHCSSLGLVHEIRKVFS